MATNTTNNYFSKPAVGGDTDTWGTTLNTNWDAVDSIVTGGTSITRLGIGTTNSTLPLICNAASAADIAASFSGLVGIGTSSPLYNLVVNDSASSVIQIRSGNDDAGHLYFADADDDNIGGVSYSHQYNFMNFKTNDTERMRITSSGNVGINMINPAEKLQVDGNIRLGDTATGVDDDEDYNIKSGGQLTIHANDSGENVNYTGLVFDVGNASSPVSGSANIVMKTKQVERMRIDSSGVVDIDNYLRVNRIDNRTGQQLVLNAGESATVATGQGDEYVYINAESGLQVNSSPDNWVSGWAGRKTATIKGDSITVAGAISATGAISGGNATFDNGTSTTVDIKCDDSGNATLRLLGNDQGTGRLYVGQSSAHGGGIEYNGDSVPVTSGGGTDYTTLFRRTSSTDHWTARNHVNSNDWEFRGKVTADELVGTLAASIFNQIYPVGSIYISISPSFNPNNAFTGSWTQLTGGETLVSEGGTFVCGAGGGSSTHDHDVTVTRDGWGSYQSGGAFPEPSASGRLVTGSGKTEHGEALESLGHATGNKTYTTDDTSTYPPFRVVAIWKRNS